MSDNTLIPIEDVSRDVFTSEAIEELLNRIREHATSQHVDASTDSGRKEIASLAHKVARSKTAIDGAGKELVAEWKEKAARVDALRKRARDYLDDLKAEVRKPLTEWEAEQERIAEEARQAEARRLAEEERKKREAEEARQRELEEKERALREQEAALRAKEEEIQRREREEQIRREAEERAKREAAVQAERAEREKQAALERAEREREQAIQQERERARLEAERAKAARLDAERKKREEQEKRARDQWRRDRIENQVLESLAAARIAAKTSQKFLDLLRADKIPFVSINYSAEFAEAAE